MNSPIRPTWLMLLLAGLPVAAQEAGHEPPADKAAGIESAGDRRTADPEAAEREALEPAVPSPVLAQDVRRRDAGAGHVMDEMDLGRTEITGNQELPKVLYIVPWKKADPGDLMGRPVNTLLDEVLAPLDREEFIRQVDYYDDLYREEDQ